MVQMYQDDTSDKANRPLGIETGVEMKFEVDIGG